MISSARLHQKRDYRLVKVEMAGDADTFLAYSLTHPTYAHVPTYLSRQIG